MTDRQLINLAVQASRNAYVPYSHFAVGAALECRDGTVFTGCNVENAALGSTICAELKGIGNPAGPLRSCPGCIQDAVDIAIDVLQADARAGA